MSPQKKPKTHNPDANKLKLTELDIENQKYKLAQAASKEEQKKPLQKGKD